MIEDARPTTSDVLAGRVAELEVALAAERPRADQASAERDRLREAYRLLQLDLLAGLDDTTEPPAIGAPDPSTGGRDDASGDGRAKRKKSTHKPTGRRRLSELEMPEERID